MISIVFIVICTLLGGIYILYGIYKYSMKEERPPQKETNKMKKKERQLEIDIQRSWQHMRFYMIGQILNTFLCSLVYFFPIFPISAEIKPAYITLLGTLTGVDWVLVSLFIFRPSILIFRHRLMLAIQQAVVLAIFGTFAFYLGVGAVLPWGGEKDVVFILFLFFMEALHAAMFLVYSALAYQDKIERARGDVEP